MCGFLFHSYSTKAFNMHFSAPHRNVLLKSCFAMLIWIGILLPIFMVKSSSSILRVYSFMHNISVSWILQRVHPMHIYTGSILKTNENRWELSGREEKQVWNSIGWCPFALLLEIWKRDSRTAGSSLTYPPTYKTFLVMCPRLRHPQHSPATIHKGVRGNISNQCNQIVTVQNANISTGAIMSRFIIIAGRVDGHGVNVHTG